MAFSKIGAAITFDVEEDVFNWLCDAKRPIEVQDFTSPNILNTNSNILLDVFKLGSKKIPVKNGWKNLWIILFENPRLRKYSRVEVSLELKISGMDFFFKNLFNFNIFNLSDKLPIPENKVENKIDESLNGSPINFFLPLIKIHDPDLNSWSSRAS